MLRQYIDNTPFWTSFYEQRELKTPGQKMDKLSFTNLKHDLKRVSELSENFEAVSTPVGFNNIELLPHQCVAVKAMLDIEDKRVVTLDTRAFNKITSDEVQVETSGVVLSEKFGSGKTIEILAFILHRPVPKAFPAHVNSVIIGINNRHDYSFKGNERDGRYGTRSNFRCEVVRRFTGPDALIRPNLVIVGSSVLVQWENAVRDFTNLKYLVVGGHHDVKKFIKLYREKKLNAFDIILVKNGVVTGALDIPNESKTGNAKDHRAMISAIANITAESCWSRVIYDDFDTISIPKGTPALNALFSVYVSATTKQDSYHRLPALGYKNIVEALRSKQTPLEHIINDHALFKVFNVRNNSDFTEASTKITKINGFCYVYANPDDNFIRLLGAMGQDDANNIMEMLNGDAIGTAADALGIKTNSVADIFQRVLDNKYEKFIHDQDVLAILERVKSDLITKLEPHEDGKRHSATDLEALRAQIIKKTMPTPKYYSVNFDQFIDEMTAEFRIAKEQDGIAINRVIDNIKEGMCQVCTLPLIDFDTFIVRCCGLIVCDVCGIKGNQITKRYDYKVKGEVICGSCANCKTVIYPQKDLIFVDKNFDMEAILKAKGDEKPAEPIVEPVVEPDPVEETPSEPEIKNPKLKALLSIIKGEIPESREKIDINIPHLLTGCVDIEPDLTRQRKILLFANFNETLNLVENFLNERSIPFLRLGGTYQEKAEIVRQFKKHGTVLLINSQQNCAGLNIQFATDLVYFHKITDRNIEAQVAGRAQRIGRTENLRIHYLVYKNEKALI